jgi:hypothetical protein
MTKVRTCQILESYAQKAYAQKAWPCEANYDNPLCRLATPMIYIIEVLID